MMLAHLLLFCSILGLVGCTAFLMLVALALLRFRLRQNSAAPRHSPCPQVSVLKPLHGLEPDFERNIESFFCQDYPAYEIIFGCRQADDPALAVVDTVRRRYPQIPVRVVISGEPDRPNAKVCSLEKMMAVAGFDCLVISDSDVRVSPGYLREVVGPLMEPKVGLVTCLYRGVPTGGLWSRLEALGMSVEMTSGVLVAEMLEGIKFALGPTMAIRRDVLDRIGGIGKLADYCADDFVLGKRVHEAGLQVVLSSYVVEHVVLNRGLVESLTHQVRWMKSTRFSRPKGHIGTVLTFAMPFGLLGAILGMASGAPRLGAALLAWALLNRTAEAVIAGWGRVGDGNALRFCWLYAARDLMGFLLWCASFLGTSIVWRGERYRLRPGGLMVRDAGVPPPAPQPASGSVAVDNLA